MPKYVTHFFYSDGWDDDFETGCHIEIYHKHTSDWSGVTCKFCLNNYNRFKEKCK